MIHRRSLLFAAVLVISHLSLLISSCTTDAYDKGEGEYSLLEAEMADVHVDAGCKADYLVTDDNDRLRVVNSYTTGWMLTPDSTYRALAYFSRREGGAQLEALNRVAVAVPKKLKDLKTDPVRFESTWISPTRQYLNTAIYLLLGSTTDEKAIQSIGCHRDTLLRNADGTVTQHITLYHDQGGVPQYYSVRAYVSIPLADIKADSVCLSINTYNGVIMKTHPLTD